MSELQSYLAIVAAGLGLAALLLAAISGVFAGSVVLVFLTLTPITLLRFFNLLPVWVDGIVALLGGASLLLAIPMLTAEGDVPTFFWLALVSAWAFAWLFADRLSSEIAAGRVRGRFEGLLVPLLFGATLLAGWEAVTRGADVPSVILPPPSMIWARIVSSVPTLAADFVQTFLKSVLAGYAIGCGLGLLVAIAIDRSPFLKRGLLPLGNFVSALPIIGVAPIMVMWFGFDWQSKAAVVVIMTFFPMLVNTVAGLSEAGHMERDLMRTYAAGYWKTLTKLRLPAAAPFIFNALKINSTLALIGAIVAEFFGTPVVGMGFRISTEVGRMNVDMVWAEIAVAALAGSAFYGVITLIERAVTFWHPSVRGGRAT